MCRSIPLARIPLSKNICNCSYIQYYTYVYDQWKSIKKYVTQMHKKNEVILGRDVLHKLGSVINFQVEFFQWNNAVIDMKPTDCMQETSYFLHVTAKIVEDTKQMSKNMDAKHASVNLC